MESLAVAATVVVAVDELINWRDSVALLMSVLEDQEPEARARARELAERIFGSVSGALLLSESGMKPEVIQGPTATSAGSNCSDDRGGGAASGNRRIAPVKRCYRTRSHPYSSTRIIKETIDDGYMWRKYGQKVIFGSNFPRSYFRCTHKHDRCCPATRQVQRLEEDPSKFVITYSGEHTCNEQKDTNQRSSYLISFGSDTSNAQIKSSSPSPSSLTFFPPTKQESDVEVMSSTTTGNSSLSEAFDVSPSPVEQSTGPTSDNSYQTLGSLSSLDNLEFDFMPDEFNNLDDLIELDKL